MTIVLSQYQDHGTRFRVVKSAQSLFGRIQRLAGGKWLHDRDANLAEGKLCEQLGEAIRRAQTAEDELAATRALVQRVAYQAFGHWDHGRDSRVGKLLKSLAGELVGFYRDDIDNAMGYSDESETTSTPDAAGGHS